MLQGKVIKDTFIVVDTFALPVEGTETRVNAAEGAYEYLTTYPETAKVGSEHIVHQLSGLRSGQHTVSVDVSSLLLACAFGGLPLHLPIRL